MREITIELDDDTEKILDQLVRDRKTDEATEINNALRVAAKTGISDVLGPKN